MSRTNEQVLVCLDLGGVVLRHCRTWAQGCASAGLDVRDPERMNTPELSEKRRELNCEHQTGALSPEDFWVAIAAATDGLYTPAEIEHLHDSWLLDEYKGVPELIEELARVERVTLACLSNTNVPHWERTKRCRGGALNSLPMMEHLTHRMVSHEMGVAKPGERIYALAEEITGFSGERIVFFDDLEENIVAARAHDWSGHQIDHEGCPASQMRAVLEAMGILGGLTRASTASG
ncbi:hypothetical protein JYT11_00880 [Planctomycetaceae bacterium AH-315-I19]|nr:hypothetical protein [Planctomycetaceae bacterium AH-315-I19]